MKTTTEQTLERDALRAQNATLRAALEAIRDMADKRVKIIRMPDGRELGNFIRAATPNLSCLAPSDSSGGREAGIGDAPSPINVGAARGSVTARKS